MANEDLKITYDDKVQSQNLPELTNIQKYTNLNANEVKDVVNSYRSRIADIENNNVNEVSDYSAIWVSGFTWDITANYFPVDGTYYTATADQLTQDPSDGSQWREDFIVAHRPISPVTIGTVEILTGDLAATEDLIISPPYDPSQTFVIKAVPVPPGSTQPANTSTELVYSENAGTPTEWDAVSSSPNIVVNSTNDPDTGTVSIESTDQVPGNKVTFTADAPINSADISNIEFRYKGKADTANSYFFVKWFLAGARGAKTYVFRDGQNGFTGSDLTYQTISIDGSKFEFNKATVDELQIYVFKDFTGFFMDNININIGSGFSVIVSGVEEAPLNGVQHGRQDGQWTAIVAGVGDMVLAAIQTVTGAKTFENAKLLLRNVADTFSSSFTNTNTAARVYTLQNKTGTIAHLDDIQPEVWVVPFSDETTAMTAGVNKVEFQMPNYATTLIDVAVSVGTAGTTSAATYDLNEAGVSVLSTKITIDATEKTSETAATPPFISDSSLAANAVMTVDLDTLDSGGTSAGGKLIMYWEKA